MQDINIPFFQYLNNKGKLTTKLPEFASDTDVLLKLYEVMVKTRIFDKKAIAMQRTGKMGTYAPVNGQEAIGAAIGHAMRDDDVFIPYYRDYAAQFQRGIAMSEILSYWGGDERGNQYVNNSHDLPICVPISSQCLHAAGVAFAIKYKKEKHVAVCTLGDGGTSEGDFYEAINVAGAWNLPLVFVVINNQWAISVNIKEQTASQTLAQKAIAAGFEGVQVDGNDILATRDIIGNAIENVRKGKGPILIEALTYRLSDHTTADDSTRYQPQEEVKQAQVDEPIGRFRRYLESQKLWSEEQEQELISRCEILVKKATEEYVNAKPQAVCSMFDFHYATLPDYLVGQRLEAIEESEND